jgi:TRAP-type C4-dicarboxylate transport system permease small subunit
VFATNAQQRDPSPLARFESALARANAMLASSILALLTLDVLYGVGTRFLLGNQARWTEEAARLLLIWLALLGGAMAYSRHAHLGLDLIVARMDAGVARFCRRFGAAFIYLFAVAVMIVGGGLLYAERLSFAQTLPALGINKAWQYLPVPISGVLIAVTAVREMIEPQDSVRADLLAPTGVRP